MTERKKNILLESAFKREREARLQAEFLLEKKTKEIYSINQSLQKQNVETAQHAKMIELFLSIIKISQKEMFFEELLQYFIDTVCEKSGWPVGHILYPSPDHSDELISSNIWHIKNVNRYKAFKELTDKALLKKGIGLPGRVYAAKQSIWIKDLKEENSPRFKAAIENNLFSAFAVPFINNNVVIAVAEFFNPEITEKDDYLLQITDAATEQLALMIKQRQTVLQYQEHLKYQSTHDTLTGLPNRILLLDRLEQAVGLAKRNNRKVVVVYIDLDHFKFINDGLGHDTGDQLLKLIAERIRNTIRSTDTLARLGGDEFVIVLQNEVNINHMPSFLKKILAVIANPFVFLEQEIHITCSVGFSVFPDDGTDPENLLKNADTAMYRAKELGRNTFQFYTSEMNARITERLKIENGLRQALKLNEFFLVYQPKLELPTNTIVGTEALLRWQHPVYGLMQPLQFIPIAEETGLILPIGEWVLRTACAQNKAWQDAGFPPIIMSVNISLRQFKQKNFIPMIRNILEETKLEPRYLELELTETLVMQNAGEFLSILKALRELGIQLAIDDFGTGYSSLSYLRQFPVNFLKIDRSFVAALSEGGDATAIIKAIVSLGHSLNLKVVAEGVETKEQLADLRQYACDEIQGFYLSRPLSPEELMKFLNEQHKL